MILRRTDMVVGLFFDLYAPEQNPAVRPWGVDGLDGQNADLHICR